MRRVFLATLIVVGVVVAALALWKLRLLIALLFLAFILAAAMRPGIEAWHGDARSRAASGIATHYLAFAGLVALLLWLVVPRAVDQVQAAIGSDALRERRAEETGWRHDALVELDRWLRGPPEHDEAVDHALDATLLGFEILIGIFFVFASAAYWIFERERAMALVLVAPATERKVVRDTWDPDRPQARRLRRGQLILIVAVATVLSLRSGPSACRTGSSSAASRASSRSCP